MNRDPLYEPASLISSASSQTLDESFNLYQFVYGNPISKVDSLGLEAWAATNKWSPSYINDYSSFMAGFVSGYSNNIDCADLALLGLIEFAAKNNLKLRLKYYAKGWNYYDSTDCAFSSKQDFVNIVLMNMGALAVIDNTVPISLSSLKAGDFIMSKWSKTQGHTRIVVDSVLDKTGNDASITWYQGNLPPVVPVKKSGLFSSIDPGMLKLNDAIRRWRFNEFK